MTHVNGAGNGNGNGRGPTAELETAELETALLGRLRARLGLAVESVDLDLIDTGLIDSLTFVELLLLLEEEYGATVEVEELDLDDFRSVRRIARYLASRSVSAGGP